MAPRWLAAGLAWWWSLHEDLHATTQVLAELAWKPHVATQAPAQLVGLAAACERRRSLGCLLLVVAWFRCQNRRISGRGSRTVRLRLMVTRDREHEFTQVRALSMEVIPYFLLD